MQEIINWLRGMEELAGEVYRAAAEEFAADERFHPFLSRLAEDESWHFHVIGSAARYLEETKEAPVSEITLNAATCGRIEAPLRDLHRLICSGAASRQDVVDSIARTEFFELNELFIYVINLFKERSKTFQYAAAIIQAHKERILQFFGQLPPDLRFPEEARQLPTIWDKRILVVDDTEPIRQLLQQLLASLGVVDTAANGQEALQKTESRFYNVIVSDIDMPVLNGIDFYQRAVKIDPAISNHFLFCSGACAPAARQFVQDCGRPLLKKPFEISELRQAVQSIIESSL